MALLRLQCSASRVAEIWKVLAERHGEVLPPGREGEEVEVVQMLPLAPLLCRQEEQKAGGAMHRRSA